MTTSSPPLETAQELHQASMTPSLSQEEEYALFQQTLNLTRTTICRWDLHSGAIAWANNAGSILYYGQHPLPADMGEWVNRVSATDRERVAGLRETVHERGQPIDIEYNVNLPGDNGKRIRVRQIGKILSDDAGKPVALVSTLTASPVKDVAKPGHSLSFLTQDLPDRRSNDRRGYNYPPAFMKHLYDAIEFAKENNKPGTFMLISINNLAMIIDGYGFEASEQVIHDIKNQITANLIPHDRIERIHRDQLGIVLCDADKAKAERMAQEFKTIIQNLSSRTSIGPLHVTCAIGSVCFPEPANSVSEALDKAYIALNSNSDVIYRSYETSGSDSNHSRKQMEMANVLHDAIQNDKLRLAFQPIIEAKTGKTAHYECLLRLIGDDGKITSAGPLIPVAERMGLIETIDRLVAHKAIEELKQHPTVSLALNISSMTTGNPDWIRYLSDLLNDDLSIASRMVIEVTETAAQRDLRETAYFVASLQALGCLVSLDDFGSGYTSFRQLKALSVDMLKIDGAFIRDLVDNADNRFFVKTLLDFTNGYGLKAVAEYVETGEIAKMLMELGVEYMQGYYFSEPLNYRPWLNEGEYTPS